MKIKAFIIRKLKRFLRISPSLKWFDAGEEYYKRGQLKEEILKNINIENTDKKGRWEE